MMMRCSFLSVLGLALLSEFAQAGSTPITEARGGADRSLRHRRNLRLGGKTLRNKVGISRGTNRNLNRLSQKQGPRDIWSTIQQTKKQQQARNRNLQDEEEIALPEGLWMTRGYGYVVQVTFDNETAVTSTAVLEETALSCVFVSDSLADAGVEAVEFLDNTTAVIDVGTNVPYTIDFIDMFQGACADGLTEPDGTVLQDFDVIVQTFNEHYAYFEERGITDWESLTAQARATLNVNSTIDDLALALEEIFVPLDDAHVYAFNPDADVAIDSWAHSLDERLFAEFLNQTEVVDPNDYISQEYVTTFEIINDYLPSGLQGTLGSITWGSGTIMEEGGGDNSTNATTPTETTIGYINIFGFDPDDEDLEAYLADWNTAMEFVQDADALVVDIRLNSGGSDVLALYAATHFAANTTLAYTLQPADGKGGLVEPTALVYMDPDGFPVPVEFPFVDKPVILLQSEVSVSAAETFALSAIQLPMVTATVGAPTAGAFSDILQRFTHNGWEFGLSNEYVRAPNGDVYEGVGIPTDVVLEGGVFPLEDRQAGMDSWLEVAVETAVAAVTAPTPMPSASTATMEPTASPVANTTAMPTSSPVVTTTVAPTTASPVEAATTSTPTSSPETSVPTTMTPTDRPTEDSGVYQQGAWTVMMGALIISLVVVLA